MLSKSYNLTPWPSNILPHTLDIDNLLTAINHLFNEGLARYAIKKLRGDSNEVYCHINVSFDL